MKRTTENRLGYRAIDENGKSLFGFMHDEDGYWITNFKSHKWQKVNKKHFHEELSTVLKTQGISVVKDPTVIRF